MKTRFLLVMILASAIPAAAQQPDTVTAAAAKTVGKSGGDKWSATTYEAATNEAQKEVLEHGKQTSVTGEVVDVSCFMELGKRGAAHVDCGSKCIAHGQPIGLVDEDGKLYLLMVEEHHPRRDGKLELRSTFAPLLSKTVTVNGTEVEMKGWHALFVQASDLGKGKVKETKEAKPAGK